MGEMVEATYLGPGEWWGFHHPTHGHVEFNAGEPKMVSAEVAEYLSRLNPWNAMLDNAADYGARLFKFKGSTGGAVGTFEDGGDE